MIDRVIVPFRTCRGCSFRKAVYIKEREEYVCFFAEVCMNAIERHAMESEEYERVNSITSETGSDQE